MAKKYFNDMPTSDKLALKQTLDSYNPGSVHSKFLNLYKKIFNGATFSGNDMSIGGCDINLGIFGDSVAGMKAIPLYETLKTKFGIRGYVYSNTPEVSSGGFVHTDVTDTLYWFNGQWSGITGGSGTVTFNEGGGGVVGNKLKIYYLKGPDFGHFKVQSSTTLAGVYADIVGYEDIDCYAETVQSAVLTITTSNTVSTVPRITGVSGDIVILFASMEDEDTNGLIGYRFDAGGMSWDDAILTASSIVSPVFSDLQLDLSTLEFKEGSSHTWVSTYVWPWLDIINAAYIKTDWILIGSPPQSVSDEYNISANDELRLYAEENNKYFFDGYTPLQSYNRLVELGWEGDGVHVSASVGFLLAGIMFNEMGLNNLVYRPNANDISNKLTRTQTIEVAGSTPGVTAGKIRYNGDLDVIYETVRNHYFKTISGTEQFTIDGVNVDLRRTNGYYRQNGVNILLKQFLSGSLGAIGTVLAGAGASNQPLWVEGATGTFTTNDGKTVTVTGGIITNIV